MVPSHRSSPCWLVARAPLSTAIAAVSLVVCGFATAQQTSDIRLSRYTAAAATPDAAQADLLEAIVQLSIPRANVGTVGEAIAYLLLRTGYRLAPQETADPQTRAVLAMPLPEVHRRLGPYTVRTALSVLLGRPYVLSVDPMQRMVSYSVGIAAGTDTAAMAGASESASRQDRTGSAR
jgi:conjugative transfer region protein (TIGR03748 family)